MLTRNIWIKLKSKAKYKMDSVPISMDKTNLNSNYYLMQILLNMQLVHIIAESEWPNAV